MNDLYQLFKKGFQGESTGVSFGYTSRDGTKYDFSLEGKTAILERKKKITQLSNFRDFEEDGHFYKLDLEEVKEDQIEAFMEDLLDFDFRRFDPRKKRIKLPFFEKRRYESDFMIKCEDTNAGKEINGLMLGMYDDKDFKDVCANGIQCDMPNCLKLAQTYSTPFEAQVTDWSEYDALYEAARKEVENLVNIAFEKIKHGASELPVDVYPVINNRLYLIPTKEYYSAAMFATFRRRIKHFNFQPDGILQRTQHLLTDWKCVEGTLNIIKNNPKLLEGKPYIDLTNVAELGMTTEEFLIGLLNDDEKICSMVEEKLSPIEEEKKETASSPRM